MSTHLVVAKGIIVVGVVALVACTADSSGESTPAKNAPPVTTSDSSGANGPTPPSSGAADIPSTVAGDPALAPLDPQTVFVPLLDWSFESASADCNGWVVSGGDDGIRAIPARTGDYSCKVCSNGVTTDLGLSQQLGAVGKGRYALSAYVRKRATTAAPAMATAHVVATGVSGTAVTEDAPAIDVSESAWQRVAAAIELPEDATNVAITVGSDDAASGDCLFVDDVVFTQSL